MLGPSLATVPAPTNLSTGTKILQPQKKKSTEYFQRNWDRIVEGFIEFSRVASELSAESLEFIYQVCKKNVELSQNPRCSAFSLIGSS